MGIQPEGSEESGDVAVKFGGGVEKWPHDTMR